MFQKPYQAYDRGDRERRSAGRAGKWYLHHGMSMKKHFFMEMWVRESNCSQIGTFGIESAVRKRGGSRNLPYLNAKPR